jgi:hypothetical protein
MVWQIDTVTLPKDPFRVKDTNPADSKATPLSAGAIIVSLGLEARSLDIEGWLVEAGKTKAQLKTDYIDPLRAKLHSTVTLSTTNGLYNGTWFFKEFDPEENAGVVNAFKYRMRFLQGSTYVVT